MSDTSAENYSEADISNSRRKRINRIKTVIVIIAVLLLILPTLFCIILGIQVERLQKQVKELADLHSKDGLTYNSSDENLAYAAERPFYNMEDDFSISDLIPTKEPPNAEEFADNKAKDTKTTGTVSGNLSSINPNQADVDSSGILNSAAGTDLNSTELVINQDGKYKGKKVYLTFDDGPSIYTSDILDILAEYQVKATFFVIGKTDNESKKLYQRIVEEGHTLGMHSYSHNYRIIYNSVEDFDKDFTKLWKLLYDTTGYEPFLFRFPGGSDNKVNKNGMEEFIRYLNEKSMVYYDWNVVNGDATGVKYTKEQLIANILNGVTVKKTSIVLMHDAASKQTTVESLPELLKQLITEGAQILPLDENVSPIQMIKADSIN